MFTGIVEEVGEVLELREHKSNLHIRLSTSFIGELQVDQSISHNGVCLTVAELEADYYEVVAVNETLLKSNIGDLSEGDLVNLERCLRMNGRIDGHFVQGHVDATGVVTSIEDQNGSWIFTFSYYFSRVNKDANGNRHFASVNQVIHHRASISLTFHIASAIIEEH